MFIKLLYFMLANISAITADPVPYVDPPDLPGIFFELDQNHPDAPFNSVQIKQLEEVVGILKSHPRWRVSVVGNADAEEGSDVECQALSEARALAVYNWLIARGVGTSIKMHKGVGKTQPIDFTETESQRRHNRRVEFDED